MVSTIFIEGFNLAKGKLSHGIVLYSEDSIECPFCHIAIETQPIVFLQTGEETIEVFLKCKKCKSSFIGYATENPAEEIYHIQRLSKGKHKTREFPKEIIEISEGFVKIYGEAEFAENENLMEICGVGYRKALEYLIKDYLIKKEPKKEKETKEKSLGNCISEMIESTKIKEIAKRATWLGNDETHYVKKWEDKDLKDLKRLIEITVHFISMDLQADAYIGEM